MPESENVFSKTVNHWTKLLALPIGVHIGLRIILGLVLAILNLQFHVVRVIRSKIFGPLCSKYDSIITCPIMPQIMLS